MIYNENGQLDVHFLDKMTASFYVCTGHRIRYQPALMLSPSLSAQIPEKNHLSYEPYEHYLAEQIALLTEHYILQKKYNQAVSTLLPLKESIIIFLLYYKHKFKGILYLGPFQSDQLTQQFLEQVTYTSNKATPLSIKNYLTALPKLDESILEHIQYLFQVVAASTDAHPMNFQFYPQSEPVITPPKFDIKSVTKHHSYFMEEELIQTLLQSETNLQTLVAEKFGYMPFIPMASHDLVRSEKNRMIIISSLLTRGAIRLGVPSDVAFSYNDFFILRLEQVQTIEEIATLTEQLFIFLRKEVSSARQKAYYSLHTRQVLDYIEAHLHEPLELQQICEQLSMNYKYASKQFKKDTGMTFGTYVSTKKVALAKKLLLDQHYKVEEISSYLGFSEPYYFSRVFKQHVGLTPSQFRQEIRYL